MSELSYLECIPMIEALHKGVSTIGIIRALVQFGRSDSNPANQSAVSIVKCITEGMDLQTAFQSAFPQLPSPISRILKSSILNSVFDYALDDTLQELQSSKPTMDIFERLSSLALKYENKSISIICNGCFERDFRRLLARAETEDATEVLLEQEGESFLHQKFLSTKLIHVIEPSNSLVYKTFLRKLNSACEDGGDLKISEQEFQISRKNPSSFQLTVNGKAILKIVFKEQKTSTEQSNRADFAGYRLE